MRPHAAIVEKDSERTRRESGTPRCKTCAHMSGKVKGEDKREPLMQENNSGCVSRTNAQPMVVPPAQLCRHSRQSLRRFSGEEQACRRSFTDSERLNKLFERLPLNLLVGELCRQPRHPALAKYVFRHVAEYSCKSMLERISFAMVDKNVAETPGRVTSRTSPPVG